MAAASDHGCGVPGHQLVDEEPCKGVQSRPGPARRAGRRAEAPPLIALPARAPRPQRLPGQSPAMLHLARDPTAAGRSHHPSPSIWAPPPPPGTFPHGVTVATALVGPPGEYEWLPILRPLLGHTDFRRRRKSPENGCVKPLVGLSSSGSKPAWTSEVRRCVILLVSSLPRWPETGR